MYTQIELAHKKLLGDTELELVSGGVNDGAPLEGGSMDEKRAYIAAALGGGSSAPAGDPMVIAAPSAPPTPPVGGDDALAAAAGSPPNPPSGGWSNITIGAIVVGGIAAIGGLGYAGYKYYKKRTSHSGSHKIK